MSKREKIYDILDLKGAGVVGSWLGNPDPKTLEIYNKALGIRTLEELQCHFDDDCRWFMADGCYSDENGNGLFYFGEKKDKGMDHKSLAHIETVAEVEAVNWGDVKNFDFSPLLEKIKAHSDKAVFSGMWCPFFHIMADLLGMEEYFIKMYTDPKIVEAMTEKIVDMYLLGNEKLFIEAGDSFDTFFFGNDFGTQIDTLISEDCFKKFVLPSFKRLIDLAKKYNKKVILHSCGAIYKVIPFLIDAGIDGLHPLQAKALNMDAKKLYNEFGKDIAFMGGVDTQDLLVNAKPQEIYDEVMRLKGIFGNNFIVSPSHEAILPNVPLANIEAMFKAIKE